MIISGGFNVFPREVEDCLSQHPAVALAAVIGIPDEKWGEAVIAAVVLKHGMTATREDLPRWCAITRARFRRPSRSTSSTHCRSPLLASWTRRHCGRNTGRMPHGRSADSACAKSQRKRKNRRQSQLPGKGFKVDPRPENDLIIAGDLSRYALRDRVTSRDALFR